MIFKNRKEAGKLLAKKLLDYRNNPDVVVLGLPRGGVVLAREIADEIKAPLDIVVPRKLGAPFSSELAIGAITQDGNAVLNKDLIKELGVDEKYIKKEIEKEKKEALRRLEKYRFGKKPIDLINKTIVLVDDGIATGYTMYAAIDFIKTKMPRKIIVAIPVLPYELVSDMKKITDELVYLDAPGYFGAISSFYKEFKQTADKEVVELMR